MINNESDNGDEGKEMQGERGKDNSIN